jgi:hypothetical protein
MSVLVTLSAPILEDITKSTDRVELNGVRSFQDVLNKMEEMFPGFIALMYNDKGRLNAIIDVYVNGESVFPEERQAKLKDGDTVSITMLYEGG